MNELIKKVYFKLFPSRQAKRVKPWLKANGDRTLRLNYDLNEDSLVFDLGGYQGQWASDIFSKYQSTIYVFEPFKPYARNITDRFIKNKRIRVFDFGLGQRDQVLKLFSNDDASSVFKQEGIEHSIQIKAVSEFIKSNDVTKIDLMKINIEGGEYELLEALIEDGLIGMVKDVQVQFHDFVPDSLQRMNKIQKSLQKTHTLTYQFEFVWENWTLKNL